MNKRVFPWIAIAIGFFLSLGLYLSGAITSPEKTALPLLTALFMSELGVMVCAGGAFFAAQAWLKQRNNMASLVAMLLATVEAIVLLGMGIVVWHQHIPT